jgi:hypothetical protein
MRLPVLGGPCATAGNSAARRANSHLTRACAGMCSVRNVGTVPVQIEVPQQKIGHVRVGSPDRR